MRCMSAYIHILVYLHTHHFLDNVCTKSTHLPSGCDPEPRVGTFCVAPLKGSLGGPCGLLGWRWTVSWGRTEWSCCVLLVEVCRDPVMPLRQNGDLLLEGKAAMSQVELTFVAFQGWAPA